MRIQQAGVAISAAALLSAGACATGSSSGATVAESGSQRAYASAAEAPAAAAEGEGGEEAEQAPPLPPIVADDASVEDAIRAAMEGPHRKPGHAARNRARHPLETLTFFGLRRDMRVVELWPGGGWYTEVLGPVLRPRGTLVLANLDPEGEHGGAARRLLDRVERQPGIYGNHEAVVLDMDRIELGADGSADMVLTFRSSHNWQSRGKLAEVYAAAFRVLKPGGVFGVVQHRAIGGVDPDESAKRGYVSQDHVIATAQQAGFVLEARSEINSNPKDRKDHPKGVWTLPPTLALGDKDKAKWLAIGESDRMTLRFRKPR